MKLKITKYTFLLVGCMFFSHQITSQTQGTKPNIIIILADDLGYGDVGFNRDADFPADRGVIPTPNLDNLANDGIILKNAHVAHPFCGPSRVSIMSGIYSHRIGAQYNLPNDITTTFGPDTNETFFPELMQAEGYNTSAFGKWHLGFVEGNYQPLDRGFDYFFGFLGGGKRYFEADYEDNFYNGGNPITNEYLDPLWRNRGYVDESEFSDAPNEDYLTDILTDEAIAYATANAPSSDPYFMYLAYNAPHTPLQAPDDERTQFLADNPNFYNLVRNSDYMYNANQVSDDKMEKAIRADIGDEAFDALTAQEQADAILAKREEKIEEFTQARITYATMVSNLDKNIGRLIDALDDDVAEFNNTLIIFLSDNGGYTYSKGAVNYPLDALKGSVKEGGHKVPMFVHWPNQITSPAVYNYQISSLDLYPTMVNLAGGIIPTGKTIDGVDFMDNLLAGQDARPNKSLAIMRPYLGFHNGGMAMGQWKTVKTGGNGSWRLYNVLTDPGETTDLRASEPTAEAIIQEINNQGIELVKPFKDVKPAWFDNDGDGSGHPHLALWNDGTLPAYNKLFESNELLLEGEIDKISIEGITDATEEQTNGVFRVSLPDGVVAEEDIIVSYSVSGDVTNNGADFTVLSENITILNGTNGTNIIIEALQDNIDEVNETVTITLTSTTVGNVDATPASIAIFDIIVPTVLTAGDVAIVGWKAATNKGEVSFLLLKDITATTKLSFSNRVWTNAEGFKGDYSIDDVWTWTAGEAFSVGDVFKLDSDGKVRRVVGDIEVEVGTTSHDYTGKITESSDGDLDISTGGDSILVFQVNGEFTELTDPNSSAWICGLNTNHGGWATGGGNTWCELPTALTNGVNAVLVGSDNNNGVYTEEIEGDVSILRTNINTASNWDVNDTTNYNLWKYSDTVGSVTGDVGKAGQLLSVTTEELHNYVNLFPNPTTSRVHISTSNGTLIEKLTLYNVSGSKVKSISTENFSLEGISTGIYFVSIETNKGVLIKKIIKI